MPRRTMTATRIWAHPFGDRKTKIDLTDLPGGQDLLHVFHGFALGVSATQLLKSATESAADVLEVTPKGRTVSVAIDVGRYGEQGKIKNVTTNAQRSEFGENDAPMLTTHGVFALPVGSTSALVFIERAANQSGVSRLLELFEMAFDAAFPNLRMETESVYESEAWLKGAELIKVSATAYRRSKDKADNIDQDIVKAKSVGDLAHTLVPSRGDRSLPRWIYESLTTGDVKAGELLGFADNQQEPADTEVTLRNGQQSKTFIIGKEKQPAINYVMTNHGQPAYDMDKVREYALDHASVIFGRLNIDWKEAFAVAPWTDEEKARRLVRQREQQS